MSGLASGRASSFSSTSSGTRRGAGRGAGPGSARYPVGRVPATEDPIGVLVLAGSLPGDDEAAVRQPCGGGELLVAARVYVGTEVGPDRDAVVIVALGTLLCDLAVTGAGHFGGPVMVGSADAPPLACGPTTIGAIYFETVNKRFVGCTGSGWVPLSASGNPGATADNPGLSCKQILDDGASTGDGPYWLDPDGPPHDDAFQTQCDMSSAGGGWTLVAYNYDKNRTFLTGSYHAVSGPLVPTPGQEAALDPEAVGLTYSQIGFFTDDPQWTSATRSDHGFWVGDSALSVYDLKSNVCQLLSPTLPSQWPGSLVYIAGDGANDNGCKGGGSVHNTGHTCDDGGGGITTNNAWPQNGSDALWGHNCISSYSPTGAYQFGQIPNQGLHAYYVR